MKIYYRRKTKHINFFNWHRNQEFKNPEEFHKFVSTFELEFLQETIYPMFYKTVPLPVYDFPYVIGNHNNSALICII